MSVSPHKIIGFEEKSTQADHPANEIHRSVIGKEALRQRSVRTGWINFNGRNIAMANVVTSDRIIQKFG